MASFLLGWGVTTGAGLASYPLDTIRRRMMMTSGGTGPHYKSMFDASSQIVAKEGVKSLFKGAGAVSRQPERDPYFSLRIETHPPHLLFFFRTLIEHPPWCCRCRCLVLVRQAPGAHVRQGLLGWFRLNVARIVVTSSSLSTLFTYHDRLRFLIPKKNRKTIVSNQTWACVVVSPA